MSKKRRKKMSGKNGQDEEDPTRLSIQRMNAAMALISQGRRPDGSLGKNVYFDVRTSSYRDRRWAGGLSLPQHLDSEERRDHD